MTDQTNTNTSIPAQSFDDMIMALHKKDHSFDSAGSTPTSNPGVAMNAAPAPMNQNRPKQKSRTGMLVGAVIFAIVLVGGVIGFTQLSKNQDIRQQASTGGLLATCGSSCVGGLLCPSNNTCQNGKCVLTACLTSDACSVDKCSIAPVPTFSPSPSPVAAGSCSLGFTVAPITTVISCQKTAYRDEFSNTAGNYNLLQQQSTFNPGDNVVFKVVEANNGQQATSIGLSDVLTSNNLDKLTFLDSNCGSGAYNSSTKTLTCPASSVAAGQTTTVIFRAKISSSIPYGTVITNNANVSSGSTQNSCGVTVTINTPTPTPTPTPSVTPTPTPTPTPVTYSCNSYCTTDAQCQTVNSSYVCSSNYCRLNVNTSSTSCEYPTTPTPTPTPTPTTSYYCNSSCSTDSQCQTYNSNYVCSSGYCRLSSNTGSTSCQYASTPTPTPATLASCNQTCVNNADCAYSNYVCVDTNSGRRCRLQDNVNSESCTITTTTTTTATPITTVAQQQTQQPQKPAVLPKTGTLDGLKFVIGGAGAVILGGLALLLL